MRQYRVWSDVYADNYAKSKSFGGEFQQRIAVGSSAAYSNAFATVEVRESSLPDGDWSVFQLFIDGVMFKRAVFNNKTKAFYHIPLEAVATAAIAQLEAEAKAA